MKEEAAGSGPITELLLRWQAGDREAIALLMTEVYPELRRLAARKFRRENPGHTLQPTAIVNEVYLRLVDQRRVGWQGRAHFFAVASQMMRRVLIDHARRRQAKKRRAEAAPLMVETEAADEGAPPLDLLALDAALSRLADLDAEQARIVELRFFGGLTVEETAFAMDLSPATIKRHWSSARAWLYQELAPARS